MTALARSSVASFRGPTDEPGVTVAALHEHLTRDIRPTMALLLAAVAVVLLIAGANLANLLLTRGGDPRQGAGRPAGARRHARPASRGSCSPRTPCSRGLGAGLGVALAVPLLRYLARLMPAGLPDATAPALDCARLRFTAGITMLLVLGFGDRAGVCDGARGPRSRDAHRRTRGTTGRGRLRSTLVVAELTLTVVLLVAAGSAAPQLRQRARRESRVQPTQPAGGGNVACRRRNMRQTDRRAGFYDAVPQRVTAIPGVTAAAFANFPPLVFKGGRAFIGDRGRAGARTAGRGAQHGHRPRRHPGYLPALGVPVVRGRDFDARDAQSSVPVAIVNRTLAERRWPNQDAIGRRIKFGPANAPGLWLTVDRGRGRRQRDGARPAVEPEVYLPSNQGGGFVPPFLWPQHLVVRTAGDPRAFAARFAKRCGASIREQAVSNMRTMDDIFDAELLNRNTQVTLVAAVRAPRARDGVDRALRRAGVYRRAAPAGDRRPIGARRRARHGSRRDAARRPGPRGAPASRLGLGVAVAVSRVLQSWLFGVAPLDVPTLAATAALLALMALLASAIPAARGASVDPCRVLRAE